MAEYTKSQFLGKIREKYPTYETWDDSLLYEKIIDKYPAYKDQIIPDPLPTEETPEAPITQTTQDTIPSLGQDETKLSYDPSMGDTIVDRNRNREAKYGVPVEDLGMLQEEWESGEKKHTFDQYLDNVVKNIPLPPADDEPDSIFNEDKRNYAKEFMDGKITEDEYRAAYEDVTGKEALIHETPSRDEYVKQKKELQPLFPALQNPIESINKAFGIQKKSSTPHMDAFNQYARDNFERINDESRKIQEARQLITTDPSMFPGKEVSFGDPGLNYMRELAVELDLKGSGEDLQSSVEYMTKWDEFNETGVPEDRWDEYQKDLEGHKSAIDNNDIVIKDFMGQLTKWAETDKLNMEQIDKFKELELHGNMTGMGYAAKEGTPEAERKVQKFLNGLSQEERLRVERGYEHPKAPKFYTDEDAQLWLANNYTTGSKLADGFLGAFYSNIVAGGVESGIMAFDMMYDMSAALTNYGSEALGLGTTSASGFKEHYAPVLMQIEKANDRTREYGDQFVKGAMATFDNKGMWEVFDKQGTEAGVDYLMVQLAMQAPQALEVLAMAAMGDPRLATILLSTQATGSRYADVKDIDTSNWEKYFDALLTGTIEYITERFGTEKLMNRFLDDVTIRNTIRSRAWHMVKNIAVGWATEGQEELAAGMGEELKNAWLSGDINSLVDAYQVLIEKGGEIAEQGVVGTLMGSIFGGGGGARQISRNISIHKALDAQNKTRGQIYEEIVALKQQVDSKVEVKELKKSEVTQEQFVAADVAGMGLEIGLAPTGDGKVAMIFTQGGKLVQSTEYSSMEEATKAVEGFRSTLSEKGIEIPELEDVEAPAPVEVTLEEEDVDVEEVEAVEVTEEELQEEEGKLEALSMEELLDEADLMNVEIPVMGVTEEQLRSLLIEKRKEGIKADKGKYKYLEEGEIAEGREEDFPLGKDRPKGIDVMAGENKVKLGKTVIMGKPATVYLYDRGGSNYNYVLVADDGSFLKEMTKASGIEFLNKPLPTVKEVEKFILAERKLSGQRQIEGEVVELEPQVLPKPGSIKLKPRMPTEEEQEADDRIIQKVVTEEGKDPEYLYRSMSEEEWQQAQKDGHLTPSEFYERTHASATPDAQYLEPEGGRIVRIKFDKRDSWRSKEGGGGEIFAVTYEKIPLERLEASPQLGKKEMKDWLVKEKAPTEAPSPAPKKKKKKTIVKKSKQKFITKTKALDNIMPEFNKVLNQIEGVDPSLGDYIILEADDGSTIQLRRMPGDDTYSIMQWADPDGKLSKGADINPQQLMGSIQNIIKQSYETGEVRGVRMAASEDFVHENIENIIADILSDSNEPFVIHKEVKDVLQGLGIKVNEGNLTKKYLGLYTYATQKVRLQSLFDVVVAAHEGAHALDHRHQGKMLDTGETDVNIVSDLYKRGSKTKEQRKLIKRLTQAYLEFYPNAKKGHKLFIRVVEGYAVLIENFVGNPHKILTDYKDLFDVFIKPGAARHHEELTILIEGMKKVIGQYNKLPPWDRLGARTVDPRNMNTNYDAFNSTQNLKYQFTNRFEPLSRYSAKIDLLGKEGDPYVMSFLTRQRQTMIFNAIMKEGRGMVIPVKDPSTGYYTNYEYRDYTFSDVMINLSRKDRRLLDQVLKSRRVVGDNTILNESKDALAKLEKKYKREQKKADAMEEVDPMLLAVLKSLDLQVREAKSRVKYWATLLNNEDWSVQDAQSTLDTFYSEGNEYKDFKKRIETHDKLLNDALEWLRASGRISEDRYDSMKEYNDRGFYTPFFKYIDESVDEVEGSKIRNLMPQYEKTNREASSLAGLKHRKGNTLRTVPFWMSIPRHLAQTIDQSMLNLQWQRIVDMASKDPAILERLNPMKTRRKYDVDQNKIEYGNFKDKSQIAVWFNGKPMFFKPGDEFMVLLDQFSPKQAGWIASLATRVSGFFSRSVTTGSWTFPFNNMLLDTWMAAQASDTGYVPIVDPLLFYTKIFSQKLGETFGGKKAGKELKSMREYLKLGGDRATMAALFQLTNERIEEILSDDKGKVRQTVDSAVDLFINGWSSLANGSEYFNRIMEWHKAREQGDSDEMAFYRASHVTVPFAEYGNYYGYQKFVKALPFFTANIAVIKKQYQTIMHKPKRAALSFLAAGLNLAIAGATMLSGLSPEKRKDYFIILRGMPINILSGGIWLPSPGMYEEGELYNPGVIKVPFPSLFQSMTIPFYMWMIQNGADYDYIDPETGKSDIWTDLQHYVVKGTIESMTPDIVHFWEPTQVIRKLTPQVAAVPAEAIFNTKFFPEMMPIVNTYDMETKYSYQQMSRYTSDMAKIVGKFLTFGNPGMKEFYQSPKVIDHIVRNTLGFPGRMVANSPNLLNAALSENKSLRKELRKVATHPYARDLTEVFMISQMFRDFYKKKDAYTGRKNQLLTDRGKLVDLKDYETVMDATEAEKELALEIMMRTNGTIKLLDASSELLSNVNAWNTAVDKDPTVQMARDLWDHFQQVNYFNIEIDTKTDFMEGLTQASELINNADKLSRKYTGEANGINNTLENLEDMSKEQINKVFELEEIRKRYPNMEDDEFRARAFQKIQSYELDEVLRKQIDRRK